MKIRGFITHKLAERYEDCQDFFKVDADKKSLAISDGMSQSIFPQWWAEILVEAYINQKKPELNIDSLRVSWMDKVQKFLKQQTEKGEPTWMLENCLNRKQGAGATLCGIRFSGYEWKGSVLGDSCLVIVNEKNRIEAIYRSQEGNFGNHPDYFDSITGGKGELKTIAGTLGKGYKLFLVTDALAELLYIKHSEQQKEAFVISLLQMKNHQEFCDRIDEWRKNKGLHNDDTTLVIVEYDGSEDFKLECVDDLKELCRKEQEETAEEQKEEEKEGEEKAGGEEKIKEESKFDEATPENENVVSTVISSLKMKFILNLLDELEKCINSFFNGKKKGRRNENQKGNQIKRLLNQIKKELKINGKTTNMQ